MKSTTYLPRRQYETPPFPCTSVSDRCGIVHLPVTATS